MIRTNCSRWWYICISVMLMAIFYAQANAQSLVAGRPASSLTSRESNESLVERKQQECTLAKAAAGTGLVVMSRTALYESPGTPISGVKLTISAAAAVAATVDMVAKCADLESAQNEETIAKHNGCFTLIQKSAISTGLAAFSATQFSSLGYFAGAKTLTGGTKAFDEIKKTIEVCSKSDNSAGNRGSDNRDSRSGGMERNGIDSRSNSRDATKETRSHERSGRSEPRSEGRSSNADRSGPKDRCNDRDCARELRDFGKK